MRLLVTGTNGQVARALVDRAGDFPEITVVAVGRPQLDLENIATIFPAIAEARPDLIVNAAAYTAVDKAEQEPQRAFAINRDGAAAVAAAARLWGFPSFICLRTMYFPAARPLPMWKTMKRGRWGSMASRNLPVNWRCGQQTPMP